MKFGFVTCVQLGLSCVEEIYSVGGRLDLIVTLHDDLAADKSGRVYLDSFAAETRVPLLKVRNINDPDAVSEIKARGIDWLFIIGWSQIARKEVLDAPTRGVLGMHPTLLPEGRGRAAIPWAILKDLSETGVTLFKLDEGVDTGPILAQHRIPMQDRETATTLYSKVNDAHKELIRKVWSALESNTIELQVQDDSQATTWPGRRPEDGRIDPTMTVEEVDRLVRAVTHPYPGAFIDLDQRRLRAWAGHPADATGDKGYSLTLSDGVFIVTEYEMEEFGQP